MRWACVFGAWGCVCAVLAATSAPALVTVRVPGRTSLVFTRDPAQPPRVTQVSAREVRASVPVSTRCEATRYRSAAANSVIDSVDISCPSAGTVDVVVRTRTDAVVSNRSTDARLYLDFTDAAATRRGATPPSKTAAHAAELAASGNVRELLKLIDTLSPSQRAAIDGEGPTLADLLEQARARQLQRDRDLLLRASRASQ